MLILALPILFETEFVLTIWLKHFPEHTVNFVRLVLVLSLCDIVSNTLIALQNSTGRIRNYQLAVGGMLMMNFPLSYLCLKVGLSPETVFIIAVVVSICCLLLRLLFLRRMAGLSMSGFLKNVCLNLIKVTALAIAIPLAVSALVNLHGWGHFLLMVLCALSAVLLLFIFWGAPVTKDISYVSI